MIDLDCPSQYVDLDQDGMLARIVGLPSQLRDAWSLVEGLELPHSHRSAENIVICGMGGSAIGGDLARSVIEAEVDVPISIIRGYELPRYVGPQSLVILSSFSGATEETLTACHIALDRGARVVATTTGGVLAERGRDVGFPVVRFAFDGRPREAVGFSLLLNLGILGRLGYIADYSHEVEASAVLLEQMANQLGPDTPTPENPAKRLAKRLYGRVTLIYGGGYMAEVGRRWKGQMNENAKSWAFSEQLPELNHNAVLGYQFPADLATRMHVVMLASSLNHPRIVLREAATLELLGKWGIESERVDAYGSVALEQVLSAVYFGDFVSYYLALINDVDPSEMGILEELKARLAQVSLD